jgi:hypothetical protein
MSFNVIAIPPFSRQLKRLAQKYPSLKKEIEDVFESLAINLVQGTPIGNNCYKIRIAISSKGKGKSGGARIITNLKVIKAKVYLLSIYDKSEMSAISEKEIDNLLKFLPD